MVFNYSKKTRLFSVARESLISGLKQAADVLLPPRCAFCDTDLNSYDHQQSIGDKILLCKQCRQKLVDEDWLWCTRCGSTTGPYAPKDGRCMNCRGKSLRYKAVLPLGRYEDELRSAVLKMKKRSHDHLSVAMAKMYTTHRGGQILDFQPDIVVPVPMHWRRQLKRGTNSAEILAVEIGKKLGISTVSRLLTRCRNTNPQKDLTPTERKLNVEGAFCLTAGYDIGGARVLLVDDILTTGATCREATGVLRRAGAKEIVVAVLARAEGRCN